MDKYYKILGLPEGASQQEIKEAYDRLAKELDPLDNENQEFFIEEYNKLQVAFEALSNSSILKSSEKNIESFNSIKFDSEINKSTNSKSITLTISEDKIEELKRNENKGSNQISSNSNKGMFKNPFSFDGRIRRLEFGLSLIVYYIYLAICVIISSGEMGLFYIFLIPGLWFFWAQGAKRCHDRNNTGWYLIIPLYLLWMLFAEGDNGDNDYGSSPK